MTEKRLLTPKEAQEVYSMSRSAMRNFAEHAGAIVYIGSRNIRYDRNMIDKALENGTFTKPVNAKTDPVSIGEPLQ